MILDTCCLLWLASAQDSLSSGARSLISDKAGALFISAISAFEIGVKYRRGALELPLTPAEWIETALDHHGIQELPVDWRIAELSTSLPQIHRDPADRIIVATALVTGMSILTPDPLIKAYERVTVLW